MKRSRALWRKLFGVYLVGDKVRIISNGYDNEYSGKIRCRAWIIDHWEYEVKFPKNIKMTVKSDRGTGTLSYGGVLGLRFKNLELIRDEEE